MLATLLRRKDRARAPGVFEEPELVLLKARRPGGDRKPPVRIFVGSEPAQYRAERVFVWSIERVRDPNRDYEIRLMRELAGFDRSRWLTGFTNYRFAVPHFAGSEGRAIYNDVDQVYLADPGELFDTPLGGHGFLSVDESDTSVMLIDCARMASVWTLAEARRGRRKPIERRTSAIPGLHGRLDPAWNARDPEPMVGRAKLVHYTTIHAQPWQPFPDRYVYLPNPAGWIWHGLERDADAADYEIFTLERPSSSYRVRIARGAGSPATDRRHLAPLDPRLFREAIARCEARTVLEFTLGAAADADPAVDARLGVVRYDPTRSQGPPLRGRFDAVLCTRGLELLADGDVRWVVRELFRFAKSLVVVRVDASWPRPEGSPGAPARDGLWWAAHLEAAGGCHPQIHWELVLSDDRGDAVFRRAGGRRLDGPPTVWILADDKAGHRSQALGLAESLGWPHETKKLAFNGLNRVSNRLLGARRWSLDVRRSSRLEPPWPDLVVSAGRRAGPIARWIGRESGGRTRIVHIGRKGAEAAGAFDLVVSCAHHRLPAHPRRIETIAPLCFVTRERLAEAASRWRSWIEEENPPRVALIVGGSSSTHVLDARTAERLARTVRTLVANAGGSLFAITSPRTGRAAVEGLRRGLGDEGARLHVWRSGEAENPYLGLLACADVLVVTGESESMLAEAISTGKPVHVVSLPERRVGARRRIGEWVTARAYALFWNARGTVRPQRGLGRLCARLLEGGWVRPPRDLKRMHDALFRAGVASPFGAPLVGSPNRPLVPALEEADAVARRIREMFGGDEYESASSIDDVGSSRIG